MSCLSRTSVTEMEEDFRDFVFANPVTLWTGMNPDFFKGTVVEQEVEKLLARGVK